MFFNPRNPRGSYILNGHEPVEEPDLMKWATWYEASQKDRSRVVGNTELPAGTVSTVFLGLDHSFGHGPRQLFETAIASDEGWEVVDRYPSWDEAEEGHAEWVQKCAVPSLNPFKAKP